jgi:hypothetical protein
MTFPKLEGELTPKGGVIITIFHSHTQVSSIWSHLTVARDAAALLREFRWSAPREI